LNLSSNSLQEEYNQVQTKEGGGSEFLDNFVKMPDGNGHITFRFLPPAPKGMFEHEDLFVQSTRLHMLKNRTYHCPKVKEGRKWVGDCPICNYYNWLWKESENKSTDNEAKVLQAQARSIKPIPRYYYNVMVRQVVTEDGIEKNVGPKIYSCGKTVHAMILRAIYGNEELDEAPLGDITCPETGRDFKVIKTMKQSGNESFPSYNTSKFLDPSPLGTPEEVEKWMSELHDLSTLKQLKDVDEMSKGLKIHLGIIPEDSDNGFDPSEFQKGSGSAAESTASSVVVEEEKAPVSDPDDSGVVEEETDEPAIESDFMEKLKGLE